jgi:hypothetical protein
MGGVKKRSCTYIDMEEKVHLYRQEEKVHFYGWGEGQKVRLIYG